LRAQSRQWRESFLGNHPLGVFLQDHHSLDLVENGKAPKKF